MIADHGSVIGQIPRKGGPGITQSDLLVINKVCCCCWCYVMLCVRVEREREREREEEEEENSSTERGKERSKKLEKQFCSLSPHP